MQNMNIKKKKKKEKKKKQPKFFKIWSRSEKGKQTSFFKALCYAAHH